MGKKADCEGECKVEDQRAGLRREMAVFCVMMTFRFRNGNGEVTAQEPKIR